MGAHMDGTFISPDDVHEAYYVTGIESGAGYIMSPEGVDHTFVLLLKGAALNTVSDDGEMVEHDLMFILRPDAAYALYETSIGVMQYLIAMNFEPEEGGEHDAGEEHEEAHDDGGSTVEDR